jgi:hypothetical protein
MYPDGTLRWCKPFLELVGYNRNAARRFASCMVFGFGAADRETTPVGKQSDLTFTPNMPGSIDVSEDNAIACARFTHDMDEEESRWFDPQLPVEFFRDMRRAVLCTARVPIKLIVQWRDDVGLTMYDDYHAWRGEMQKKQVAERRRRMEVKWRKNAKNARRKIVNHRKIAQREKVEEYWQYLLAKKRERVAWKKRRIADGKKIGVPLHLDDPVETTGGSDD